MPGPQPDLAFDGRWEQRGMIHVPVLPPSLPPCIRCQEPSLSSLCVECRNDDKHQATDHEGSHAQFNNHRRRGEVPCYGCEQAESIYQAARYERKKANRHAPEWVTG